MKRQLLPYKIIGALDTETTNFMTLDEHCAFPCLFQLGTTDANLRDINADNVEYNVNVSLYRHAGEVYNALDKLIDNAHDYVPIIMVHNLGFDMFSLSPYINRFDTEVCAKNSRKPITITLKESDTPKLRFWDTLGFSAKSLAKMGEECGYNKLSGSWDYNLIRTPDTILSADELAYATHDIYALCAYIGYWLRLNPDIEEAELGSRIITKTGVVRYKRKNKFFNLKGIGCKQTCGNYWMRNSAYELPKTDDELTTMHAATSGGFTFIGSKSASVPYECKKSETVAGFDATSQHPAQMISHYVPCHFKEATCEILDIDLELIEQVSVQSIVDNWARPFPVAFYALIHFENIRLKADSVFEREGIASISAARLSNKDKASNARIEFGKIVSADELYTYITELDYWIMCQVYEWDNVNAISGYETARFVRPTDYSVLSVMEFYRAKALFKSFMSDTSSASLEQMIEIAPASLIDDMLEENADAVDVKAYYQILKSDLNALYGIEITNEAKPEQYIDKIEGIKNEKAKGIDNLPSSPKTWYQYGARIVGWSRVSQVIHIIHAYPYCKRIINGDTDSLKMLVKKKYLKDIKQEFAHIGNAINRAQKIVCARVERCYPDKFLYIENLGRYELEFEASEFFASWNKAYMHNTKTGYEITLAGIPTYKRLSDTEQSSITDYCVNEIQRKGRAFSSVAPEILGYNVTFSPDVTRLNAHSVPKWATWIDSDITDYKGNTAHVIAPAAIALYPEPKIIGSFDTQENRTNFSIAKQNNEHMSEKASIIFFNGREVERMEM